MKIHLRWNQPCTLCLSARWQLSVRPFSIFYHRAEGSRPLLSYPLAETHIIQNMPCYWTDHLLTIDFYGLICRLEWKVKVLRRLILNVLYNPISWPLLKILLFLPPSVIQSRASIYWSSWNLYCRLSLDPCHCYTLLFVFYKNLSLSCHLLGHTHLSFGHWWLHSFLLA